MPFADQVHAAVRPSYGPAQGLISFNEPGPSARGPQPGRVPGCAAAPGGQPLMDAAPDQAWIALADFRAQGVRLRVSVRARHVALLLNRSAEFPIVL